MQRTARFTKGDWSRKLAVLALIGVMGATVSGETRAPGGSGALAPSASLSELASHWTASASHALTFGILYGTVLSRMAPDARQAIVAAVEGVREICAGQPAKPLPVKCSSTRCPSKTPARCTRA